MDRVGRGVHGSAALTADDRSKLNNVPADTATEIAAKEDAFSKNSGFNLALASNAEAEGGVATDKVMSPFLTALAIAAQSSGGTLGQAPVRNISSADSVSNADWGKKITADMSGGTYSLTIPPGLTSERFLHVELSGSNALTLVEGAGVTILGNTVIDSLSGIITLFHTNVQDTYQVYANDPVLLANETAAISKAYSIIETDLGAKSSGSLALSVESGYTQLVINGGAFTLTPQASYSSIVLMVTNGGAAGAINTSAYDVVNGDPLTTVDGDVFMLQSVVNSKIKILTVIAKQ